MALINRYTDGYPLICLLYYVNSLSSNFYLFLPPAESADVNTLTETSLARVPFSTLTIALTLPASSLTEYSVMLKPIVTPKKGVNNACS